jgi:hypothetical protein
MTRVRSRRLLRHGLAHFGSELRLKAAGAPIHWARTPRDRHQCGQIPGAPDRCGSYGYLLEDRRRHHELDRAHEGPIAYL